MPQNNLQEKLKTVKYLVEKLIHLRNLIKQLKTLQETLLLEDLTLSGTHILERLKEKITQVEGNLYKAVNDLVPRNRDYVPISYIGTADLINGYVPLFKKDGTCTEAFVITTGATASLEILEPEIEETV